MSWKFLPAWLSLCLVIAYGTAFAGDLSFKPRWGVSELISSTTLGPAQKTLNILFIGNSLTGFNDMPGQFLALASADIGNTILFNVQSVIHSGSTLEKMWHEGKAAQVIGSNHWDYVVLQEHSNWGVSQSQLSDTWQYAAMFDELVNTAGGESVLYITWPKRSGSYEGRNLPHYGAELALRRRVFVHTMLVASSIGASVVNVGVAWSNMQHEHTEIELYEDFLHPNMYGTYLSALVFYKHFSQRDVTQIPFAPSQIPPATAAMIRETVQHSK